MDLIAKIVSYAGLAATIGPSLLYYVGLIGHKEVIVLALIGTIAWFVATPWWMGRETGIDAKHVEI